MKLTSMKWLIARPVLAIVAGLVAATAGLGCPVYSDQPGCSYATDCAAGFACTFDGYCVVAPGYGNYDASTYDAASEGATVGDGAIANDSASDGATDAGPLDASSSEGAALVYCGNPSDCAADQTCSTDGTCRAGDCNANACINQFQCSVTAQGASCTHGDSHACSADRQCLATERCIDGTCSPLAELCSDQTQCPSAHACVEGRCVATCTSDPACPLGSACRLALGICDVAAKACALTSDCGGAGDVCVAGSCVPRCHAFGACGEGAGVCVDNGCVPAAKIVDQCDGEGTIVGCGAGQVCLHHHCYVSCQSPNGAACASLASAPICKTITVVGASYSVCAAAPSLGSECDPTAGNACASGKTCIDGFCR